MKNLRVVFMASARTPFLLPKTAHSAIRRAADKFGGVTVITAPPLCSKFARQVILEAGPFTPEVSSETLVHDEGLPWYSQTLMYKRALEIAAESKEKWVLLSEDDAEFMFGWDALIFDAIQRLAMIRVERFVLVVCYRMSVTELIGGPAVDVFRIRSNSSFHGTTGVVMSSTVASEMLGHYKSSIQSWSHVTTEDSAAARLADWLFDATCRAMKIPILVLLPSVMQHIGDVSHRYPSRRNSVCPLYQSKIPPPIISVSNLKLTGIGEENLTESGGDK